MERGCRSGSGSCGSNQPHELSDKNTHGLPPRKPLPFLKPPNKIKYNQNIEELESVISKHEGTKSELLDSLRRSRESQRVFREERDNINQRKNSVFQQLDKLNEEARKKNDIVTKQRGGIPHLKQEDIDAQIRKLEYQINKVNFKLTEEKRIVSEIDRLRRSKKNLKEYDTLKEELDKLRTRQHSLRLERDAIFQDLRELKRKEDDIRQRIKDLNTKLDQTRADIDHYRDEKYALTAKFRDQENDFRQRLRQRKEEQRRRDAEDHAARKAQQLQEHALYEANKVPYEHEIFLCNLLIRYTQSLVTGKVEEASLNAPTAPPPPHLLSLPSPIDRRRSSGFSTMSDASSHYATPMGCTPVGTPLEGSPPSSFDDNSPTAKGYYKKKEVTENFYNKSSKKSGKKTRKTQSSKKLLAHNPETFTQFAELDMFPPTQAGEVPDSLQNIKEKLAFYQSKSDQELRMKNSKEQEIVDTETASAIQIVVDPVQIVVEDSEVVDSINQENVNDHENSADHENSFDHEISADQENSVEQENSADKLCVVDQNKNDDHENNENFSDNKKYDHENGAKAAEIIEKCTEEIINNCKSNQSNGKAYLTLNLQQFTLPEKSSYPIKNGGTSNGLKVNGDATNTVFDADLCTEENIGEATMTRQKTEMCGEENGDSISNDNSLTTVSVQTQDIHPSIL